MSGQSIGPERSPDRPWHERAVGRASQAVSRRQAAVSAVAGLLAYGIGYVGIYLLEADGIVETFGSEFHVLAESATQHSPKEPPVPTLPPDWKLAGMYHAAAHLVPLQVQSPHTLSPSTHEPALTSWSVGGVSVEPALGVPVLALLLAGLLVGVLRRDHDPALGATAGSMAALGYLPAAVGASFLFTWAREVTWGSFTFTFSVSPHLIGHALVGGVLYPLLLGGLGGALGAMATARLVERWPVGAPETGSEREEYAPRP